MCSLKEEIKALKDEKMQLQRQLEEEQATSGGLQGEVARLSQQAKVEASASPALSESGHCTGCVWGEGGVGGRGMCVGGGGRVCVCVGSGGVVKGE